MRMSYLIMVLLCLQGCRHSGGQSGSIAEYDSVTPCLNGTGIVSRGGKFGVIDSAGVELVPLVFDDLFYLTDDIAAAIIGENCEFYDRTGRRLGQTMSGKTDPESLLKAYSLIREDLRKKWDMILDSYQRLDTYCASGLATPEQAKQMADDIRKALGGISGPMGKDQQARFEAIRRSGQ